MGTSKPDAGTYAPSGPPTCAARTGRPVSVPPPYASTSSRRLTPKGSSTMPPCLTLPASWKTWVPRDRPVPSPAYLCHPGPPSTVSLKIIGTAHSVSTLLTAVGLPQRPLIAGIGGLARTSPRRPPRLSTIAHLLPQ